MKSREPVQPAVEVPKAPVPVEGRSAVQPRRKPVEDVFFEEDGDADEA